MFEVCLVCGTKEEVVALQPLNWYSDPNKLDCSDQLHVILLLRKILKLRKSFLESLLRSSGQDPASWNLKLCKICHKVFEEASFVSLRLCKLNQDFEELAEALRTRIVREDVEDSLTLDGTINSGKRPGRKRKAGKPFRNVGGFGADEGGGLPLKVRKEVTALFTSKRVYVEQEQPNRSTAKRTTKHGSKRSRESHQQFAGRLIKTEKQSDVEVENEEDYVFEHGIGNSKISESEAFEGMPILPVASTDHLANDGMTFRAISNDDEIEGREPIDPLEDDDDWNETAEGLDEAVQMSDDDDSDSDFAYKPSSRRRGKSVSSTQRSRTKRPRPKKINQGLIFAPKKLGDSESFRCPKCCENYDTFELCKEHILHSHYNGKWPQEFPCHLCKNEDNMKFNREYWLKQHLAAVHPGEKLPVYEKLERFIEEGVVPELTYKVVPISETKESNSGRTTQKDTTTSETNSLNAPQDDGNLEHLNMPGQVSNIPKDIMKLLERDPEGKKCQHCGKCLPSEIQLQAHIKFTHEGEHYCYACPLCPRMFERIGAFMEHLHEIHFERKRHFCEKCGQTFNEEILLQAHIQRNHFGITNPYKCIICGSRFNRLSLLNQHLVTAHQLTIESYVPVRKGGKGRGKGTRRQPKIKLNRKGRYMLQETKAITCDLCVEEGQPGLKFSNIEALDIHVKRTHMRISRPYSCTICEKQKYSTPAKLEKHMETNHTVRSDVEVGGTTCSINGRFVCLPCAKTFKTESQYNQHMKGINHEDDRPHVCEICSRGFRELSYLKHHQSLKHYKELNLTPNMCSFCGRIFASMRTLDDHIKTKHTKDARFKCPHCPMFFQYKVNMNKHVNALHTKKDIFMCTQCPKQFFTNCNLKFHQIRVHSGTKPYECSICSKTFSDKPTYNRHVEAHSNIIHDCPHCGKTGFKTRHSLRVHVRATHEGIRRKPKSEVTNTNAGESELPGTSTSFPVVSNVPGQPWGEGFRNDDVKYFVD